jgi:glycosyltransferase involved in cell wall biosynthesis
MRPPGGNYDAALATLAQAPPAPVIAHGLFSWQIGGSERVGADLSIEFKRRGYRVVCFAFYDTDGPVRRELEAQGIPCVDLNYETRPRLTRRLTYQLEMWRFLRRFSVDALLVHHATALVLCGIPAKLAGTRRVVMVEHAIHQLRERPRYRAQAMRYLRFADMITGVDPGIVDYFRDDLRYDAARLLYIANGVRLAGADAAVRSRARAALGIGEQHFMFLFAGRLQPVKDVGTLLSAVAQLPPETRGRVRLCLAGDGPERAALEAQARRDSLEDLVHFLGARSDVPVLLAAADAFIMTSITEGQPMALIEAMAARLPCVATSVGGIPRLLGEAGLLVPARDHAGVAQAMTRVVSDAGLRARLSSQAFEKVAARHDLARVTDTYLSCLGLPATPTSA